MLFWLASYPRSGNKFTQLAMNTLYGVRLYTIYPKADIPKPIFIKGSDLSKGLPEDQEALAPGGHALVKTHEFPDSEDRVPAVYILRDGRDAYVSYAHYVMNRHPGDCVNMTYPEVLEMLIRSRGHFGGWSGHVEAWTGRPHPTAVIRYEDMLADPGGTVLRACTSLGMTLTPCSSVMPTFEEEHSKSPVLVRKGKAGSWREEMPDRLERLFWSIHGPSMEKLGYIR